MSPGTIPGELGSPQAASGEHTDAGRPRVAHPFRRMLLAMAALAWAGVAHRRALAHHEAAAGQVVRQVLGGDAGHKVIDMVDALAPGEPQHQGQAADQVLPRRGDEVFVPTWM